MELSIIIINYNVTSYLRNCILSIKQFVKDVDYEIIVFDNHSTDTSWQELIATFPSVHFIKSDINLGFAKANNKAAQLAKGKYLLLLNPDTLIEDYSMKQLLNFADTKSDFGSLGVRMHDAAGNFHPESKRSIPDMYNSFEKLFTNFKKNTSKSYYRNDIPEFAIAEVDVLTGAFFLCRKEVYQKIGGLDERYFMYGEDIDICYTLKNLGYKNYYYGKTSILHYKGESTIKNTIYLKRFYGAMHIFVNKYYAKKPIQKFLISLGLKIKLQLEKQKIKPN